MMLRTGSIRGFSLIESINHAKYGIATYVRSSLKDVTVLDKIDENNITVLAIKVNRITVLNVYKPPNVEWSFNLPIYEHPAVYMGDFNSHHELWNYTNNDQNENENFLLIGPSSLF